MILASAIKRGYRVDDLLHAVAFAIRRFVQDDGMTIHIGPDRSGNLMEVGVVVLRDGTRAIAHAMKPPRAKFTATQPTERRR